MSDKPVFLQTKPAPASDRLELKEASATALERGLAFVDTHGDGLARLRARVGLEAATSSDLVDALVARQEPDGAWPRLGVDLCEALGFEDLNALGVPVAGCLDALSALGAARALHTPPARSAEAWLRSRQNADGSWGPTALAPSGRLYATAVLAGLLGRTDFVRPAVLDRAGDFLAALWSPEAIEGGRWSTLAAFALFFTNVHHDLADAALQWCGRELERGFRTRRFDALLTARVLLDCDAAALPAFEVAPEELAAALVAEQAADGGYAELAAAGPGARVGATLDALRAIVAVNRAF